MRPDACTVKIRLPPISDEAVVEIHDFLYDFVDIFETHYAAQIHRFYQDQSCHNLVRPDPTMPSSDNDPPF
jgi:hypothetical protein